MSSFQRWLIVGLCLSGAHVVAFDARAAPRLAAVTGITGAGTGTGSARLWGELGFHDQEFVTSISSELGFGLLLTPSLELEAILPLGYAKVPGNDPPVDAVIGPSDNDGFDVGNPYVGINIFDARLRWSLGVGLPVASSGDAFDFGLPLYAAWATRGLQDAHLWLPDTLSLVGRLRAEAGDELVLAFDGAAITAIPTSDGDDRDVEIILQPAAELIIRAARATSLGARLSMVWAVTGDGDDVQLALAPFLRHSFGSSFITAQLLMNLDEPLGFAFDDGGYWGFFLGFGGGL